MTRLASLTKQWVGRGLLALPLIVALAAAPVALADDDSPASITLYAPGATQGVSVGVQRQAGSGWVTVNERQVSLTHVTDLGVPYETFIVDPADYGQGLYRWVIYNLDGRSVWATSDLFFLPTHGGLDVSVTVGAPGTAVGEPAGAAALSKTVKTIPAPAVQAPLLAAAYSTQSTLCNKGDCNSAQITAFITGLPVTSWVAIEWQDERGYWHPVPQWEGPANLSDPTAQLIAKQWMIMPDVYGHGPFRWAVYSGPQGGILGVSPTFSLPTNDRQNDITYLTP